MRELTQIGLKLFALGFIIAFFAGFTHPALGWMLDLANVLGGIGVINLLVSFEMYLKNQREERQALIAEQTREILEASKRPAASGRLMMLELPLDLPSVYVRCEIHGTHVLSAAGVLTGRPRVHYHQDPPQVVNGVVLVSPHIRAYYEGNCPECEEPEPCRDCGGHHGNGASR